MGALAGKTVLVTGVASGMGSGAHAAAKAGVKRVTKAMALESAAAATGVRVNSVHAGHVDTPLTDAALADPEARRAMIARTPLGRMVQPGETAKAMTFLARDLASVMSGAEVIIDGGCTTQ